MYFLALILFTNVIFDDYYHIDTLTPKCAASDSDQTSGLNYILSGMSAMKSYINCTGLDSHCCFLLDHHCRHLGLSEYALRWK
jgi:hypothetical protein